MAKYISRIEGMIVNDSSAIHDISVNARSYTMWQGNSDSVLSKTLEVDVPTDVNAILDNLTVNLILKDSSDSDIECYSKGEIDASIDAISSRQTVVENHSGQVGEYDPYATYTLDSLTEHDGFIWRCVVTQTSGAWDESCWRRTSLIEEIEDLRGVQTTVERVTVNVGVNRGGAVIAGTQVSLIFDSSTGKPTQTVTLDSTGKATFFVNFDDTYYLEGSVIVGYQTPTSPVYTACMANRNVYLQYKIYGSGIFIIDNNGVETDVSVWDSTRTDGRFVRFTNSALCPEGTGIDNSIVISKVWNTHVVTAKW